MPLISVVVATYNSAKTLIFALKSIQKQTMEDFEALVIGDGCTDESHRVVSSLEDPRFQWINLPKRLGIQSGPNNEGIRRAKGQYIAYLGHDDLWFPWHLAGLLDEAKRLGSDLVFSLTARICPSGTTLLMKCPQEDYIRRNAPPSSWLHRKDLTDRCGLWNCSYKTLSLPVDTDLWRRVCLANMKIDSFSHLTVLKFPSVCWSPYAPIVKESNVDCLPQKSFFEQLAQNPNQLQIQILMEMSFCWSEKNPRKKSLARRFLSRLIRAFYKTELFPFLQARRWAFQKMRKQRLKKRGLFQDL